MKLIYHKGRPGYSPNEVPEVLDTVNDTGNLGFRRYVRRACPVVVSDNTVGYHCCAQQHANQAAPLHFEVKLRTSSLQKRNSLACPKDAHRFNKGLLAVGDFITKRTCFSLVAGGRLSQRTLPRNLVRSLLRIFINHHKHHILRLKNIPIKKHSNSDFP